MSRYRPLLLGLIVAFAATAVTPAFASNAGFKQSVLFPAVDGPSLHWLSLPYLYAPSPGTVDAEDLCLDLSDGGIAAILRWHEPSSTFVEHSCGGGSPFPLTSGIAYGVRVVPDWSITSHLSGGHDDDFVHTIPPSGDSQLSWLSMPYHLRIPEKVGDHRITAEDLCRQIGSATVFAIVRWDPVSAAYQAHGCGSSFQTPFEVRRGEGFGVINRSGQTVVWEPLHF